MADYVGAIDQGTTSTRFMIFDHSGSVVAVDQKEHEQIFPRRAGSSTTRRRSGAHAGGGRGARSTRPASTPTTWPRSGSPTSARRRWSGTGTRASRSYNAIVWQDTRTDRICRRACRRDGGQDRFRAQDRSAAGDLLLGAEDPLDARQRQRRPGAGRERRPPVRQHRHVAHLEPDRRAERRRPRHRRDQRQPDAADEPRRRSTGTTRSSASIGVPRAMLPEIRSSSEVYGDGHGAARGHPGRRGSWATSRRPVRADLLLGRARPRTPTAPATSCC